MSHLLKGDINSCGCQRSDVASERMRQLRGYDPDGCHLPSANGMSSHPLHNIWRGILDRCENPRNSRYRRYGGRGIRACDRWHDITLFVQDIEREIGVKPARCPECGGLYSLDRIDNDRGYEPGNALGYVLPAERPAHRHAAPPGCSRSDSLRFAPLVAGCHAVNVPLSW